MSVRRAAGALDRPPMPAAPSPAPGPTRATRRITLDLTPDDYRALKLWAVNAEVDVSALLRALLELARTDPPTRTRAEAAAVEAARARRGAA